MKVGGGSINLGMAQKCRYMLLMNKLTAINKGREGQMNAMNVFIKVWTKCTECSKVARPQDNVVKEVLELV